MSFVLWGRSLCRQTARISARSPVIGSETAKRFSVRLSIVLPRKFSSQISGQSTSSSTKRSAKQKHKSHEIRSLNPKWLSLSGQEILDISGRTGKSIKISAQESFFVRYSFEWDPKTGSSRRMVAPPDTTGFLYYHRPRDQPEIAGQIRFRVCSDATRFEQGRDLDGIIPGVPWSIHLWQVVKYWPQFCSALLKEGLVDQSLVDDLKRLNLTLRSGLILYSLSDPITLKLSHEKINITFVTRKAAHQIPLRRLFAEQTHQTSDNAPYEGKYAMEFVCFDR